MSRASLIEKIRAHSAQVGIIGLGYVGLPLACTFIEAGFRVIGFDIDEAKVSSIRKRKSYIRTVPDSRLEGSRWPLVATEDMAQLGEQDVLIICVPTPLTKHREPDLGFIVTTIREIAARLQKGQLVVLESTTYPGTTLEIVLPVLQESGLVAGEDFFLGYSPEREDPGNEEYNTRTIPKIVSGATPACLGVVRFLYEEVVDHVVPVSSTRVAEMTKLVENTYRCVNIALVNELKVLCHRMDLDIHEVLDAAATKPFGFQRFSPGPGLGGHCIPLDPFYLTWKAREFDFHTRFIELSGEINTSMPYYIVRRVMDALNGRGKSVKGAQVLVLGIAYKKDVDDARESPSFKIMELLEGQGAGVRYHDPFFQKLPKTRRFKLDLESTPLTPENIAAADCVLIVTDHSSIDYRMVLQHARLIVDSRGRLSGIDGAEKVVQA